MNDINNNKELQKLFEDYDKLGITPHRIMGLEKLLPHGHLKGITTAAGAITALAATGLVKGAKFLGKQAFMKTGFLKVLKRIGEIEDYVINGNNAEDFKYMKRLKSGGKITSIKHYDEIKEKILNEIKSDIKEFKDFENSQSDELTLNDQGSLVHIVNKYKKFFSNINANFSQINSSGDEDIYNSMQKIINENISSSDKYVNTLISKFRTKYMIGKEENPYQNKRLDKYIDVLNQAWNTVKEEIIRKYKQLAIDINRSVEFKALYDLVTNIYQKLPVGKRGATKVLQSAINLIKVKELKFDYIENNNKIQIIDSNNFNNSKGILKNESSDHYITEAINYLKLKTWELNSASFKLKYDDGNKISYFYQPQQNIKTKFGNIILELDIPKNGFDFKRIVIEWNAKFDIDNNYYPIEGSADIINTDQKNQKIEFIKLN